MKQRQYQKNELYRQMLSVSGLSPWDAHTASQRKQMFSSHIGQFLVINGATERYCQTGLERQYAKTTFSVKMPCDAQIIRVIDRYNKKIGPDAIVGPNSAGENPQTIIIYEDVHTKEVGMVSLIGFCSYHQYFGFQYKRKPGLSQIYPGAFVAKDTILLDSPLVTDDGGYMYGAECNVAYITHPAVSEDGIVISRDVLSRFGFKTRETRVIEFGKKRFPLNLYGSLDVFKPFPDIGEKVREDGLLMCLRNYDNDLAPVEQSIYDVMEPEFTFDKPTYVPGGGTVIDIRVHHERRNNKVSTPALMEAQLMKYDSARHEFYQEILNEYYRLKKDRGAALQLSYEFHRMVGEAISVIGDNNATRVIKTYRQAPLDEWRIEIDIQYENTSIRDGFKLTDCHGGKGVICHICEPHEMPVDSDGNRADIIMDPNSTINRMNLGRMYEQYINGCSRDVAKRIREEVQIPQGDPQTLRKLHNHPNKTVVDNAWNYLLGYYKIVSPERMWKEFSSESFTPHILEHLASIIEKHIYLYLPPENEPDSIDMIKQLQRSYHPTFGPVSYIGNSGLKVTTKNKVRIGSVYFILLEKTADDWTAVSSGKLQHFGVLSQITNADKYSQPSRNQAIRAAGESEIRIYISYAGERVTAEVMDRNNNPRTHQQILYSILQAPKPTDIQSAVNRKEIPLGEAKPNQLVKHIALCGGWEFSYQPFVPPVAYKPLVTI